MRHKPKKWTFFRQAFYPPRKDGLDKLLQGELIYKNNIYQVAVRFMDKDKQWQGAVHLSIKRIDRAPAHDWRHFQRIKNELVGPEREGFEFYPPESQLVDSANQYHLWVLPVGMLMPLVFRDGRWVTDKGGEDGSVQRPFEHPPDDLKEMREEFKRKYELAKSGQVEDKGELSCLVTNSESSK
jgi:hypothetical protein